MRVRCDPRRQSWLCSEGSNGASNAVTLSRKPSRYLERNGHARCRISRSRAPETTSWYVSSSTWANFNTRHDREQLIQSKQFKAVWSHVTERNSPMHLRQEKQETYHTQTRGHSPAQLIHPAHSNATLSTWGPDAALMHAKDRIL